MHHLFARLGAMALFLSALIEAPPVLAAFGWQEISQAEGALLPTWCLVHRDLGAFYAPGYKPPLDAAKLERFRRENCGGAHHYCWAMVKASRGYSALEQTDQAQANAQFSDAIGDYGYALSHSNDTCSLVPDMHAKIGELQTLLGHPSEAEASFTKALRIKPGYPPAYIGLSDLYEALGKNDQAIATLEAGIKANPTSSALKKKLDRVRKRLATTAAPSP